MENFDKKIAFIGCGNMGKALASAISAAGFGDDLLFCDHTMNKAQSLAEQLGGTASELEKIVKENAESVRNTIGVYFLLNEKIKNKAKIDKRSQCNCGILTKGKESV